MRAGDAEWPYQRTVFSVATRFAFCGNHFIEGDNISTLCTAFDIEQQCDLIYIDPPYNTGQRFVYDDDFRKPYGPDSSHSGHYSIHSQWLNMMYPRLKVAREFCRLRVFCLYRLMMWHKRH